MQAETNTLRVAAIGESAKSRLLRNGRIGFAASFSNTFHRFFQVADLEENIYPRPRVVAMQADANRGGLKPSAALRHRMERPSEDLLEKNPGPSGIGFSRP